MRQLSLLVIVMLMAGILGGIKAHALDQHWYSYPYVMSYPLNALPQGTIMISVGHETFYYDKGSFYQMVMREQKYILVPPPIGAVIFTIPEGYQLMLINGRSIYQYNGVFYKRVLDGYKVINPPQ